MSETKIRFGVFAPQGWRMDLTEIEDPVEQYEAASRVAKAADDSAFDSVWVYDHFHTVPTPAQQTTFECWTTTAALARDTRRVRIGQMVTCNGYRHPAVLAKMASTVDVLSHGRLNFGLGAGWYEQEWNAYGLHFPDVPTRMGMFREACEIINRMWTEDAPRFRGKYYEIDEPINQPKGVQKPRPAFWIGGGGERVTLRLVARWADACNVGGTVEQLHHKFDVLRKHCEDLGRDYDSIIRSHTVEEIYLVEREPDAPRVLERLLEKGLPQQFVRQLLIGTPEQIAAYLRERVQVGVNYFVIYLRNAAYEPEQVSWFSRDVIPLVG